MDDKKNRERLLRIGKASESEWRRTTEKESFKRDLEMLREGYRLPLRTPQDIKDWLDWLRSDTKRYKDFSEKYQSIKGKYQIDKDQWKDKFFSQVVYKVDHPIELLRYQMRSLGGMPGFKITFENERPNIEIISNPDMDIDNPIVKKEFKRLQLWADPPPIPQPIKGHPRRKKDWRPVFEWHLRHPNVTLKELAKLADLNYKRLRLKMSQLEKEI